MSFSSVRATIETHISDNWTATPVAYDNVDLDTSGLSEYISINLVEGDNVQATLGDIGTYQAVGVLVIMIFTDKGIGSSRARQLADQLSSLFRGSKIDGMTFKVPSAKRIIYGSDYFQYNLSIPFYAFFNM